MAVKMDTFLGQLPALVGVLVGALASYLVTVATERRRWRRSMDTRWDERRVVAYAEYATAVKAMFDLVLRLQDENLRQRLDRPKVLSSSPRSTSPMKRCR
jgi:hypothetical protein